MEQKFKTGDVVRLKSGGPKMTVGRPKYELTSLSSSEFRGLVNVTWFDETKSFSGVYHQDQLELDN